MDQEWWTISLVSMFARFDSFRFFLWGHVKTIVYAIKFSSLKYLKAKITNVISGITVNQLANVFHELQNCITLNIANDGGHVKTKIKFQYNLKKYRFTSFQSFLQIISITNTNKVINTNILFMSKGEFIDFFKLATVCPVFKKGDSNNINNYRPVSAL